MKKIKDLAVKVSEYTNRNGEKKGNWVNVGAIMQGDDGSMFVSIERTFNPAGVPFKEGRSTIAISAFDPKDDKPKKAGFDDFEEEMPF